MGEESDKEEKGNFFQQLPAFWKCQLAGWGLLIPYAFITRLAFWEDYRLATTLTLALEPLAFVLSLGMRWLYRKLRLKRLEIWKVILLAVAVSLLASVVELVFAEWVLSILSDRMGDGRLLRLGFFWAIFFLWSLGYFWLRNEFEERKERKKLGEVEIANQRAELAMLRLQLNPHFLFNSLTNIEQEIPENPSNAVVMTGQLAKFLQYSLERQNERMITLSDEVEAVRNYLAIEEVRFTNRLSTKIYVSREVEKSHLPCLLLLPLVENAVKHGVMTCSPPWKLTVEVEQNEAALRIRVSNSGTLFKDWQTRQGRLGIANLRRRLELYYPGRHQFGLSQEQDQVVAEVVLEGAAVDF